MIIALPKRPAFPTGWQRFKSPVGLIDLLSHRWLNLLRCGGDSGIANGQTLRTDARRARELGRVTRSVKSCEAASPNRLTGHTIANSPIHLTLWYNGEQGIELYDHQDDRMRKTILGGLRPGNSKNRKPTIPGSRRDRLLPPTLAPERCHAIAAQTGENPGGGG